MVCEDFTLKKDFTVTFFSCERLLTTTGYTDCIRWQVHVHIFIVVHSHVVYTYMYPCSSPWSYHAHGQEKKFLLSRCLGYVAWRITFKVHVLPLNLTRVNRNILSWVFPVQSTKNEYADTNVLVIVDVWLLLMRFNVTMVWATESSFESFLLSYI